MNLSNLFLTFYKYSLRFYTHISFPKLFRKLIFYYLLDMIFFYQCSHTTDKICLSTSHNSSEPEPFRNLKDPSEHPELQSTTITSVNTENPNRKKRETSKQDPQLPSWGIVQFPVYCCIFFYSFVKVFN